MKWYELLGALVGGVLGGVGGILFMYYVVGS